MDPIEYLWNLLAADLAELAGVAAEDLPQDLRLSTDIFSAYALEQEGDRE